MSTRIKYNVNDCFLTTSKRILQIIKKIITITIRNQEQFNKQITEGANRLFQRFGHEKKKQLGLVARRLTNITRDSYCI